MMLSILILYKVYVTDEGFPNYSTTIDESSLNDILVLIFCSLSIVGLSIHISINSAKYPLIMYMVVSVRHMI